MVSESGNSRIAPFWPTRGSGLLLFLFAIVAGLAIYMYRLDVWQTALLVLGGSALLGLLTFSLLSSALSEPTDQTDALEEAVEAEDDS